jgi:competence protein ComEC
MSAAIRHTTPDLHVGLTAAALIAGAWLRHPAVLVGAGAVGAAAAHVRGRRRLGLALCLVTAAGLGVVLGRDAWLDVAPDQLGPYRGWVTLVDDPRPLRAGLRVAAEVEGERFESIVFGSARRRLASRQAGERVELDAVREELSTPYPRSAQARHVVGELRIERVWTHTPGTPLSRASNRLRLQLRRGADGVMSPEHAALFAGLVIGDDTRQPPEMIGAFRRAGLSHLTAVSGQNVALVLAVVGLGLRRLRTWWRLTATLAVIAWFAVITRLEPSVLRASCMAALTALGFALGRERSPLRLLLVAVMILVIVDPLLVWSVGFWLSVGATFGVVAIAPVIERRLTGPRWWTNGLAVTLGAQMGVLLPSWLVFHRMPAVGIVANLLAVPVAGFVMLYGLPAALVASLLPAPVAVVTMAPATIGTRWVALVAETAALVEPTGATSLVVWLVQLAVIAWLIVRPAD